MRSRHWSAGGKGKQDAHAQVEAIQQDIHENGCADQRIPDERQIQKTLETKHLSLLSQQPGP